VDTRSWTNLFLVCMTFGKDETYGTGSLAPANHVMRTDKRDRTGRTFSQECQRYLDIRRLHELVLVSEDVIHGARIRGIQSRGLGQTNTVSTVKTTMT